MPKPSPRYAAMGPKSPWFTLGMRSMEPQMMQEGGSFTAGYDPLRGDLGRVRSPQPGAARLCDG